MRVGRIFDTGRHFPDFIELDLDGFAADLPPKNPR